MACQPTLGNGHANRVANSLAERAGRGFHAGRQAVLGMSRGFRAPLAELLEVFQSQSEAREEKDGIEQHGSVTVGEDKAVAIRPIRVAGIVAKVFIE